MKASGARRLNRKSLYRGRVVHLVLDQVVEPGNVRAARELVIHGGSVVVMARLSGSRLLLVRQFRYAAGKALWEFVAGGIEPGETPAQAAQRELMEESGYRASEIEPVLEFYPSPGVLTERMYLFEARGLSRAKARPDPDERIRVGTFTLKSLFEMVRKGRIQDGKTLVGLLWLNSPFGRKEKAGPHSTPPKRGGRTRRPREVRPSGLPKQKHLTNASSKDT